MAKGNPLLGTLRRSIGDVTFYRRDGEQVSRARIRKIGNPRTDAQTIRRLAFSSASKTAQHLRGIVDHSFQGVRYGQTSVNHFVSMLAKDIGSSIESALIDPSDEPYGTAPVLPYAAAGVAAGAKMLISSGDLKSVPFEFLNSSPFGWNIGNQLNSGWSETGQHVEDFENIFGVPFTDQLTFVFGAPQTLEYISETELFYGVRFVWGRINFLPLESVAGADLFAEASDGFAFNLEIIDDERSDMNLARTIKFTTNQGRLVVFGGSASDRKDPTGTFAAGDVCLAGIIVSRFESGVWRRSTTRLIRTPKNVSGTAVDWVQNYGVNDVRDVIELSVPSRRESETEYLNKEPNA